MAWALPMVPLASWWKLVDEEPQDEVAPLALEQSLVELYPSKEVLASWFLLELAGEAGVEKTHLVLLMRWLALPHAEVKQPAPKPQMEGSPPRQRQRRLLSLPLTVPKCLPTLKRL